MSILHASAELIARVDRFGAWFNAARFEAAAALPGNPFGAEVQHFGDGGIAVKVRSPLLRGKNRVYGFRGDDLGLLADLLTWYRADNLVCSFHVPAGQMSRALFRGLTNAGFWSQGIGTSLVAVPDGREPTPAPGMTMPGMTAPGMTVPGMTVPGMTVPGMTVPGMTVRVSGPEEKDLYLDVFQQSFAAWPEQEPEYRAFQWAEDSLPGGVRFLAESAGKPVGMASFPIVDGVGFLGTAGVLPQCRGRGVHLALIQRRLHDAAALGGSLVIGGGSLDTTTFRNQERAGLRLIPSGSVWRE